MSAQVRPERHLHPRRAINLGIALLHKAGISENKADVNEAIEVLDETLTAIGLDHPGRALTLYALGVAHARAFELGKTEALDPGLAALRDVADIDSASAVVRIRAGRDRGRLAASGKVLGDELDGIGSAVRLMEEAAWAGLGRADQQLLLTVLHQLGTRARPTPSISEQYGQVGGVREAVRGISHTGRFATAGALILCLALVALERACHRRQDPVHRLATGIIIDAIVVRRVLALALVAPPGTRT